MRRFGSSGSAEALRDRRRDVVAVDEHDGRGARGRDRELDRDLGAPDAGRSADGDEPARPARASATATRRARSVRAVTPSATSARTNASGPASDSIDGVDVDRGEVRPARRLGEIVHAEHAPPACVHVGDERARQRRPAMTHDEHVVRLLERDALLDHEAAHPRAAVIGQVAVQLLDPRLGREDERDLRFAHDLPATDPTAAATPYPSRSRRRGRTELLRAAASRRLPARA